MTRYILIDEHSGYVWGEADAADPAAACRIVDESIGSCGREYEDIGLAWFNGRSGYHVYQAPADFPVVDDGQDQLLVKAVSALPLASRVATSDPEQI